MMGRKISVLYWVLCIGYCVYLSGCTPTYPKEKFKECVVDVCKKEYKLDVKVETIGTTIAIYLPLHDLLDFDFSITKRASEEINDVILTVSRVSISTDADYEFYCIIAHDTKVPEIQIVIIKSVNDVKRFMLNDISRGEYSKRMLVDIRLNPQAQKEKAIKEVFEKMAVDKKWQEEAMSDFFQSEPAVLGDIGYWGGKFYVKDISMPEFIASQIANRVRTEFREDKDLSDLFEVKISNGTYVKSTEGNYFKFEIAAEPKFFKDFTREELTDKVFGSSVKVAAQVLNGYKFTDFDYIEIISRFDNKVLTVLKDDLEKFRKKKIKLEDILVQAQ